MAHYYLNAPLKKFHQLQMRVLLEYLNKADKNWLFTDLIKCYVWQGSDQTKQLNGRVNRRIAISHCRQYLDRQIAELRPRKILVLGKTVAQEYFRLDSPKHGSAHMLDVAGQRSESVYSVFPARKTADLWVEKGGWEPVIGRLCDL